MSKKKRNKKRDANAARTQAQQRKAQKRKEEGARKIAPGVYIRNLTPEEVEARKARGQHAEVQTD